MTDNEIIKAWEYCKKDKFKPRCSKCPLKKRPDCQIVLELEILPLLNRQKAEIESQREYLNVSKIRAEAIKEFAGRVKILNNENLFLWKEDIDDLVKEMVGENDDR